VHWVVRDLGEHVWVGYAHTDGQYVQVLSILRVDAGCEVAKPSLLERNSRRAAGVRN
jgi:hypothetical protein